MGSLRKCASVARITAVAMADACPGRLLLIILLTYSVYSHDVLYTSVYTSLSTQWLPRVLPPL